MIRDRPQDGLTYRTAIHHGDWRIWINEHNDFRGYGRHAYQFEHKDLDGPDDTRFGYGPSVRACKELIDNRCGARP